MKAKELRKYLDEAIEINPNAECSINGNKIHVNTHNLGDIEFIEIK